MVGPPGLVVLQETQKSPALEVAARGRASVDQEVARHRSQGSAHPAVHREAEARLAPRERAPRKTARVRRAKDLLAAAAADLERRGDGQREADQVAVEEGRAHL